MNARKLIGLLVLCSTAAMSEDWTRDAALQTSRSPFVDAEVQRLLLATPWLPGSVLREELALVADRTDWPAPVRDRVLYEYALELRDQPVQHHAMVALEALRAYQPQTLVPHPESEFHRVPLFNVGAASAGTLNAWAAESMRERALVAANVGDEAFFAALSHRELTGPEVQGLAQAVTALDRAVLDTTWSSWETILGERPEAVMLARPLTQALGDARALYVISESSRAVSILAHADELLPLAQAQDLWRDLAARPGPATGPSLVRLADTGAWLAVKAVVADGLADPSYGADRALALARAGAVRELAAIALDGDQPEMARRRAALGLKLEGSGAAEAALRRLQGEPSAAAFAGEVSKWLD